MNSATLRRFFLPLIISVLALRALAVAPSENLLDNETLQDLREIFIERNAFREANNRVNLPDGAREVLFVTDHVVINSSFGQAINDPVKPTTVILLKGRPSKTSFARLTRAVLVFYPHDANLPSPLFDKSNGLIELSMRTSQIDSVMRQQVEHERVVCWIEGSLDGRLYGDLQSQPRRKTR